MTKPISVSNAGHSSSGLLLALVFKALMWLNGLAVAVILAVALGLFPLSMSPNWLRLPLALFLASMLLSLLGLFWSGLRLTTLRRYHALGYARRAHWISALFAGISYVLALIVFAAACWALLGVASLSHYYEALHHGIWNNSRPHFQHP